MSSPLGPQQQTSSSAFAAGPMLGQKDGHHRPTVTKKDLAPHSMRAVPITYAGPYHVGGMEANCLHLDPGGDFLFIGGEIISNL